MQRIYYNKKTNLTIHENVTCTLKQIKSRYGDDDYAILDIDVVTEGFLYKNGELKKVDLIAEREARKPEDERNAKIQAEMFKLAEQSLKDRGEL